MPNMGVVSLIWWDIFLTGTRIDVRPSLSTIDGGHSSLCDAREFGRRLECVKKGPFEESVSIAQ